MQLLGSDGVNFHWSDHHCHAVDVQGVPDARYQSHLLRRGAISSRGNEVGLGIYEQTAQISRPAVLTTVTVSLTRAATRSRPRRGRWRAVTPSAMGFRHDRPGPQYEHGPG
jgi:hypothetical protein